MTLPRARSTSRLAGVNWRAKRLKSEHDTEECDKIARRRRRGDLAVPLVSGKAQRQDDRVPTPPAATPLVAVTPSNVIVLASASMPLGQARQPKGRREPVDIDFLPSDLTDEEGGGPTSRSQA